MNNKSVDKGPTQVMISARPRSLTSRSIGGQKQLLNDSKMKPLVVPVLKKPMPKLKIKPQLQKMKKSATNAKILSENISCIASQKSQKELVSNSKEFIKVPARKKSISSISHIVK